VRLGGAALAAHLTPGHAPGSTTWTWSECVDGHCLHFVYADSLSAISAPGFHFLAADGHADLSAGFRKSIHTLAALPCDILITVHPDRSGMPAKLGRLAAGAAVNPFVDPHACERYARESEAALDARIEEERHSGGR